MHKLLISKGYIITLYAYDDKGFLLTFYEGRGFVLTVEDKLTACVVSSGYYLHGVRRIGI